MYSLTVMTEASTYDIWKNYETLRTYEFYSGVFADIAKEHINVSNCVETLAHKFHEVVCVKENYNFTSNAFGASLAHDLVLYTLTKVDFEQIAAAYIDDKLDWK